MTHAPGPWWIDIDGDYLCICEGEVNEYGEREEVATLACNRPSLLLCQPANARLIAAAPELLEVCRKLLAWQSEDDPYACDDWMEFAADLGAMAGQAIAKAEGVTMEGTNGKERSLD
jgi:hypothetical protein